MRIPGNVILQIILLIPSNGTAVCTGFSYNNTIASSPHTGRWWP